MPAAYDLPQLLSRVALREQSGQDASSIEFTVEELEDRIAPIAGNFNLM